MSLEKIQEALIDVGFTSAEAKVCIYLAKMGPKKASETLKSLKMRKQQLYPIIRNLQRKGIVTATLERPARFSAVPLSTVLDIFTKSKLDDIKKIQENKEALLKDWKAIHMREVEGKTDKIAVLDGRKFVYSKMKQMLQEADKRVIIIAPLQTFLKLENYGVFDQDSSFDRKSDIKFQFITELTNQNLKSAKTFLQRTLRSEFETRVKNPDVGLGLFPEVVIKDNLEILLFINPRENVPSLANEEKCLWTNCDSIINSFQCIFDELWRNSIDLATTIIEIETGQLKHRTPITQINAHKKIMEVLTSAEKEVTIVISSKTLLYFWEKIFSIKEWKKYNVSLKIMTPITKEILPIVKRLASFSEIRHIPESQIGTIVIDNKKLFQFTNQHSIFTENNTDSIFENPFYSNDREYIDKIKSILDNQWRKARTVSSTLVEEMITPKNYRANTLSKSDYTYSRPDSPYKKLTIKFEEKPKIITEKEVLKKIINGKKHNVRNVLKDKLVFYGYRASALIYPPDYLGLPKLIISTCHWNEKSSFGKESWLEINLWQENCFVPVAVVQDRPETVLLKKDFYANTPAGENISVKGKDAFKITVHGNTLFVGWTFPISLIPEKYVLPPASLLFEAYGQVKTGIIEANFSSGRRNIWEYNGFEAFVTFFHPKAIYSGPGVDGTYSRDAILTSYPSLNKKHSRYLMPRK